MSESPRPLGPLILLIVGVLVALAVFWVGFMLAPAAVLLISYLALSAGERARHPREHTAETLSAEAMLPTSDGQPAVTGGQIPSPMGWRPGAAGQSMEASRAARASHEDPGLVEAASIGSQTRGART